MPRTPVGVRFVQREELALSRAPVAELAGAALQAAEASGLDAGAAAFIVIAVPADAADDTLAGVLERAVVAELETRVP